MKLVGLWYVLSTCPQPMYDHILSMIMILYLIIRFTNSNILGHFSTFNLFLVVFSDDFELLMRILSKCCPSLGCQNLWRGGIGNYVGERWQNVPPGFPQKLIPHFSHHIAFFAWNIFSMLFFANFHLTALCRKLTGLGGPRPLQAFGGQQCCCWRKSRDGRSDSYVTSSAILSNTSQ